MSAVEPEMIEIGEPEREITFEPMPLTEPAPQEAPAPAPAPVKVPQEEPVPAGVVPGQNPLGGGIGGYGNDLWENLGYGA